jgi:thiol-disulfide isomerase/thioredoxin
VAQNAYTLNNVVSNFAIKEAINTNANSLNAIKRKLTIIDFFGTWCAPCIKALPHLEELQKRFGDSVAIVLISNEEKAVLQNFVQKTKLVFPLIIDADNSITNLFQPPSYPYTVVMNTENKIIQLANANALTIAMLQNALQKTPIQEIAIKNDTLANSIPLVNATSAPILSKKKMYSNNSLVALSQQLLYAAKTNNIDSGWIERLANLSFDSLVNGIDSDNLKKAFWINIYNAFTYIQLTKNASLYNKRSKFFGTKNITIANKQFSLDAIEHGILRRSKIKWSLGYVNKFFPSSVEKKLRVDSIDYQIHFALNCGAKSCPPIAFYGEENLEQQLQLATKNYLQSEVQYKKEDNLIIVPKLMSWFKADFGGRKGIYKILQQQKLLTLGEKPKLKYLPYNWTLYLNNFKN